jgi:hypothetical protein
LQHAAGTDGPPPLSIDWIPRHTADIYVIGDVADWYNNERKMLDDVQWLTSRHNLMLQQLIGWT